MKQLIFFMAAVSIALFSCNTKKNASEDESVIIQDSNPSNTIEKNKPSYTSNSAIIESYLQLKNALAKDDDKKAAESGRLLAEAIQKFDKNSISADQLSEYEDLEADMKEHAEHISENSGNIEHQREHFVLLSNDMFDFVKSFGTSKVLFKYYCSMSNENKGAVWLSETKDINNPYFGSKMESCGEFQEEIPAK